MHLPLVSGFSSWFCLLLFLLLLLLCSSAAVFFVLRAHHHSFCSSFSERVSATFSARSWEPGLSSRSQLGTVHCSGWVDTVPPLHASRVDTQLRCFQHAVISSFLCVFVSSFFHLIIVLELFLRVDPTLQHSSIAAVRLYYFDRYPLIVWVHSTPRGARCPGVCLHRCSHHGSLQFRLPPLALSDGTGGS